MNTCENERTDSHILSSLKIFKNDHMHTKCILYGKIGLLPSFMPSEISAMLI